MLPMGFQDAGELLNWKHLLSPKNKNSAVLERTVSSSITKQTIAEIVSAFTYALMNLFRPWSMNKIPARQREY